MVYISVSGVCDERDNSIEKSRKNIETLFHPFSSSRFKHEVKKKIKGNCSRKDGEVYMNEIFFIWLPTPTTPPLPFLMSSLLYSTQNLTIQLADREHKQIGILFKLSET